MKLVVFLALLTLTALAAAQRLVRPGPPDFCLEGPFHKDAPSPEEEQFSECLSWQDHACCNLDLSVTISMHQARGLYNYSWDVCGTLSPRCEEFIKDEECFYQCEPMLGYFQIGMTGYIQNVPVCSSYCDAWFDACKDDLTCVENWLEDFDFAQNGNNSCPVNSTCVTFREMYGNGEGLCNRMWGSAFFYSNDTDNCTVMVFDNSMDNPNYQLSFLQTGGAVVNKPWSSSVVCALVLLLLTSLLMGNVIQ